MKHLQKQVIINMCDVEINTVCPVADNCLVVNVYTEHYQEGGEIEDTPRFHENHP